MHIGLVYNMRHTKPDLNNPEYLKEAEFDEPTTIEGMTRALEKLGHTVVGIEANEDAYEKLRNLKSKIDLVFNVAEGMHGADREAQLPAMMEMLQIPYTGPKPLGYAVGLNKSVAKEILTSYGIATPHWMTVSKLSYLEENPVNFFPVIAKPLAEGSSKGITAKNLVDNTEDLKNLVAELLEKFHQPVIIEEYLPGREFTVAVIGNPARVLPIVEITFNELPEGMPKFDHFEAKWIYDNPEQQKDPVICPAVLTPELKSKIEELCLRSFDALEMRDWARIDVRLDKNGTPSFIEVNCPPGVMPDPKDNSRFVRAALADGLSYEKMLEEILQSACKRYGIVYEGTRSKE
ncbi:MAG: D-alanine-D-alanine ligase-like protein [Candidatus Magasanikbacteria bacterium GW2011_GWC2_34_16]|uniref:D-alanine-D-alanine ligase-like protein n=2 Tax=Candidatus Magasanikiibacteriota TaxID=1752731 RepID=A0A0G0KKK0_9BACT|nr:MAG: D-alanine-D-alanine ligase-like protein [Candidatus Magasanikbacteria bacterium GW2011_GWC2_34_16]KKQ41101.1 MAG: D-alanine-D-alanine ligase-like protein [Candidatus Magasanikbacteria bacterium GW2011_GWA2_37_8]